MLDPVQLLTQQLQVQRRVKLFMKLFGFHAWLRFINGDNWLSQDDRKLQLTADFEDIALTVIRHERTTLGRKQLGKKHSGAFWILPHLFGFGNRVDTSGFRMKYSSAALLMATGFLSRRGSISRDKGVSTFGRRMHR